MGHRTMCSLALAGLNSQCENCKQKLAVMSSYISGFINVTLARDVKQRESIITNNHYSYAS